MSGGHEMNGVLSQYVPASWLHPVGIFKVVKKLEPKLPDVSGCLFITLTLDPGLFQGPRPGFEKARDRIRRMFHKLRKGVNWEGKLYRLNKPYCVKVEFHENGWPHFHIVYLSRRFLPGPLLTKLWAYGRTHVDRISNRKFRYLLKYVTKSGRIPDWVLEIRSIRIFQASPGFYRKRDPPEKEAVKEPNKRKPQQKRKRGKLGIIRERLEKWERQAKYLERGKHSCFQLDDP